MITIESMTCRWLLNLCNFFVLHPIDRITADPNIFGGKPIIKGTRISVEFILDLLASDMSEEEILEDYPHITKNDIHACLRYAARSCKNEIYVNFSLVAA